jgi:hypothetical protein
MSAANDFGAKHKTEDAKADSRVLFCVLSGKYQLRSRDGPPAFAGAESGFAGVTVGLAWCIFRHPCAGRDPCERVQTGHIGYRLARPHR